MRRQRLDRPPLDVVEQDDAAPLRVHRLDDAVGDRQRNRIGPVLGVDVPQHRRHGARLNRGQDFLVPRAVRRPEQHRRLAGHVAQQAIGLFDLARDLGVAQPRQQLVREGVIGEHEAGVAELAAGRGRPGRLHDPAGVDRAEVLAHCEEHRRNAPLLEHRADARGVARMRAIVEREEELAGGQARARRLEPGVRRAVARAAGPQHDVDAVGILAQNPLDRVARYKSCDIGVPRLAVNRHPARLKPPEDALHLAVVERLDLVEGGFILLEPLPDRRRRLAAAARGLDEIADEVAERQLVRIAQIGVPLERVEEATGARRGGRADVRHQWLGKLREARLVLVKDHPADHVGASTRLRREHGVLFRQHHDLAEAVDDRRDVGGQRPNRRVRLRRRRRRGGGPGRERPRRSGWLRRLPATAGEGRHEQAQGQQRAADSSGEEHRCLKRGRIARHDGARRIINRTLAATAATKCVTQIEHVRLRPDTTSLDFSAYRSTRSPTPAAVAASSTSMAAAASWTPTPTDL